jgi:subtilisin family serine protease
MKKLALFLSITLTLVLFAPLFPQNGIQEVSAKPTVQSGSRYIVSYDGDNTNDSAVIDAVTRAGGSVVTDHSQITTLIVDSANPGFAAEMASVPFARTAPDMVVNWLSPDELQAGETVAASLPSPTELGAPQNAVFLASQWNLSRIQASLAWNTTLGSSTVKVAVLDTGICAHHQDMIGKVRADLSASFINEPASCGPTVAPACVGCPAWEDRQFHGTHVAGIISSNNLGTASVAPNVQLIAVKVLNCTGSGPFSAIINGIIYAANSGAEVINMSLGAFFSRIFLQDAGTAALVESVAKAIQYATKNKGCLVVSAAGNNGTNMDTLPGNKFINIPSQAGGGGLSVSASTIADQRASFSNFGLIGADLIAPGGGLPIGTFPNNNFNTFVLAPCSSHSVQIPSCAPGNNYLFVRGTSQASPHVAGAAALVISRLGPPGIPPRGSYLAPLIARDKLLSAVTELGIKGPDQTFATGRLNVARAVQ